jgi:hypothetical protein
MSYCGFGIYYYLYISGSIVITPYNQIKLVDSFYIAEGGFLEKVLRWYLEVSTNLIDEITFLLILVSVVTLPQILSSLISGLFGCGRPPVLVLSVTKYACLSFIKSVCVLSALSVSQFLFLIYKHLVSFADIGDLFYPLVVMSLAFALSVVYCKSHEFVGYVLAKILPAKILAILKRVWDYMTKYKEAFANGADAAKSASDSNPGA